MRRTRWYLVRSGWRQLRRFRLRSALVISCAALGVAGAITAVNYASSGQEQVLEQIRRLGTNVVIVSLVLLAFLIRQSRAIIWISCNLNFRMECLPVGFKIALNEQLAQQ